jgi:protease-4
MKKFVFGFLLGLFFAGLAIVILAFAAVRIGGGRKANVADNSTLVLHMEGDLPEQAPMDYGLPFLSDQQSLSVAENWQLLRNAAADPHIKAIVLEPRGLSVGWAKLEELRGDIVNFKKSGKPVYAYLRGAGMREYYVATAADRIYTSPEDELDVKGLRAELTFVKGALDKLGVDMEFEHVGKYKDAPDMFTKTSSSPETREVIDGLLDQFYGDFVASVAEGRKKTLQEVRALIDNGPFVGPEALKGGLVDELAYEDQVFAKLKEKLKLSDARINERDYATLPAPAGVDGTTRIALLVGQGDIVRGATNDGVSGDMITATGMIKAIRQVRDDDSIKGVILRIDSPGGDGIASDDILHEAELLSQKKPTVISMSDLAASGGYFIAMTGDPLIAYRATETGSIGVFFGKPNLRGLYDKIGVRKELMTRGRFADIDTDAAPLTDAQRAKLRSEIELFYRSFVEKVASARKRKYDDVDALAQGRVWTGAQAKQNGLVDELGGIDRAIALVKQRAKIAATEKIKLVAYPPRRTLFQILMDREQLTEMESRVFESGAESRLESKLNGLIDDPSIRSLLHALMRGTLPQGGILSRMPYSVTVR